MAAIGDLVEVDEKRQGQIVWGCLYKDINLVGKAWATTEYARPGERYLVVERQTSRQGKKFRTSSNKRHVLLVIRLSDNKTFWVDPKYTIIIQKADS